MSDPPRAEIETRSAHVTDVRFPERVIDLVAVPYDEWALVEYKGRMIEESFDPGAFGAIQNRARRFLVNLEHDPERVTGRVNALHPDRPEGLVAELRIRRGPEGDQVLDDADDGLIGASVGFGALPEHQHWETRSRRKIMRAFLDHIGLTVTRPTRRRGARRAHRCHPTGDRGACGHRAAGLTPNLDRIMLDRLRGALLSRLTTERDRRRRRLPVAGRSKRVQPLHRRFPACRCDRCNARPAPSRTRGAAHVPGRSRRRPPNEQNRDLNAQEMELYTRARTA